MCQNRPIIHRLVYIEFKESTKESNSTSINLISTILSKLRGDNFESSASRVCLGSSELDSGILMSKCICQCVSRRQTLTILIPKLQRIFEITIEYAEKHNVKRPDFDEGDVLCSAK